MEKERKQKILDALELIKNICVENPNCEKCPLGTCYSNCNILRVRPQDWNLSVLPEETWRAFKKV